MSIWTEQLTQFGPDHWRSSAKNLGGGEFMSHGCHYVDILLWFLGRPVRGVHLGTNFGTPWMEKDGTSNAVIEFEGGQLGYHFGTWGARGTKLGYSFQAHCTEGMLEIDFQSGKLIGPQERSRRGGCKANRDANERRGPQVHTQRACPLPRLH